MIVKIKCNGGMSVQGKLINVFMRCRKPYVAVATPDGIVEISIQIIDEWKVVQNG